MKMRIIELAMACMLLLSFYFLSREAADVSLQMTGGLGENNIMNAADSKEDENNQKGSGTDYGDEKNVIVVDPGHGGDDPGMIGEGGLKEKGINLEISLKVKQELEKEGYTVVLTREEDVGLYDSSSQNKKAQDMQRRIALIQEVKPVLTISIHQNSYQDSSVKGPQVFYYEDSVEGERLAVSIQNALNEGLSVERPRVPKGNTSYYLLKRSPGILNIIECGFLTNPGESALLQNEKYQQKVAAAIVKGICSYLDENKSNAEGLKYKESLLY